MQVPIFHLRIKQKAASRGIPLAAALQIFSPDLRNAARIEQGREKFGVR
jgi:hypothetical protein